MRYTYFIRTSAAIDANGKPDPKNDDWEFVNLTLTEGMTLEDLDLHVKLNNPKNLGIYRMDTADAITEGVMFPI